MYTLYIYIVYLHVCIHVYTESRSFCPRCYGTRPFQQSTHIYIYTHEYICIHCIYTLYIYMYAYMCIQRVAHSASDAIEQDHSNKAHTYIHTHMNIYVYIHCIFTYMHTYVYRKSLVLPPMLENKTLSTKHTNLATKHSNMASPLHTESLRLADISLF